MIYTKSLTLEDRVALENFYRKAYPQQGGWSEYLHNTIFSLPSNSWEKSLLIYDDNKIIGVNLAIPTKALIGAEEYDIVWSYDTFVLPEYRNTDAGIHIASYWVGLKNGFGAGLSTISERMNKIMKNKFIAYASAFIKLNWRSKYLINIIIPILPLNKILKKKLPEIISLKNLQFKLITDVNKINIPEDKYWNKNIIEFKRDLNFYQWRFFRHNSPYYFYKEEASKNNVFFVVRIKQWHNLPLLYIVDYRLNLSQPEDFDKIINGASYLVKKTGCAGIFIRCSLESLKKFCKKRNFIQKGEGAQIVTGFKPATKQDYPVFFTPADSDMDFK